MAAEFLGELLMCPLVCEYTFYAWAGGPVHAKMQNLNILHNSVERLTRDDLYKLVDLLLDNNLNVMIKKNRESVASYTVFVDDKGFTQR